MDHIIASCDIGWPCGWRLFWKHLCEVRVDLWLGSCPWIFMSCVIRACWSFFCLFFFFFWRYIPSFSSDSVYFFSFLKHVEVPVSREHLGVFLDLQTLIPFPPVLAYLAKYLSSATPRDQFAIRSIYTAQSSILRRKRKHTLPRVNNSPG